MGSVNERGVKEMFNGLKVDIFASLDLNLKFHRSYIFLSF